MHINHLRSSLIALLTLAASSFMPLHATAAAAGLGPSFKGPLGLQLYSLRADFIRNVPQTLKAVQDFGFQNVELAGTYNLSPQKFKELLVKHQLNPVSAHFPFDRFRTDAEGVARDAKILGVQYVGCAWIPHEGDFDEQECRNAIEVFNQAGKSLAGQGLKFFYHVHGYEFQPHGNVTFLDLMMTETNPDWVRFQMDVFWVMHPGHDPVQLLAKYGARWELMHLKDMKKGLKGDLTGKSDVTNDVPLGTGQMNWKAILAAGQKAGVKWYFIEDESPTVTTQIPQSLRYLETLQW